MTPSSDPAETAAEDIFFPAEVLEDGEIVLLTVKPSAWYVLLSSWPVLLAVGLVAVGTQLADRWFSSPASTSAALLICSAVACLRVFWGCIQWMGQLYVLTNVRALQVQGLTRPVTSFCLLRQVSDVTIEANAGERPLRLGSLRFEGEHVRMQWACLAQVEAIQKTVLEAVRRAR